MHQAAVLDGSALDALALQQERRNPTEIDVRRGQIVQAPVMAPVFKLLNKFLDLAPMRAEQYRGKHVIHVLSPAWELVARRLH